MWDKVSQIIQRAWPYATIIACFTLPLLVTLPHLNESFFGADFNYEINRISNPLGALQVWDTNYLGGTSFDAIKLHSHLLQGLSYLIGGFKYGPLTVVYVSLCLYLITIALLLGVISRNYLGNKSRFDAKSLFIIITAFFSPLALGYLTNYFTIGILYYTGFMILALAQLLIYNKMPSRKTLLLIVLCLGMISHPPTFFFSVAAIVLCGTLLGALRLKELLVIASGLLLLNIYWVWPLLFSLLDKGSISLSNDSGTVEHIFTWFENSVSILNNSLFSIYPNSKLWNVIPLPVFTVMFVSYYIIILLGLRQISLTRTILRRKKISSINIHIALTATLILLFTFSLGSRAPSGWVFTYLWEHISVMHLFKSFTQVLNVAFPFFLAILYISMASPMKRKESIIRTTALCISLACIAVAAIYLPRLNTYIARGTIPQDYFAAKEIVDSDIQQSGKLFMLPEIPYEYYAWNNDWDNYFISQGLFSSPVVNLGTITPTISRSISQNFTDFTDLIENNNFSYVMVRKDTSSKYQARYGSFNKDHFVTVLDNEHFTLYKLKPEYYQSLISTRQTLIQEIDATKTTGGTNSTQGLLDKAQAREFLNQALGPTGNYVFTDKNTTSKIDYRLSNLFDYKQATGTENIESLIRVEADKPSWLYLNPMGGELSATAIGDNVTIQLDTSGSLLLNGSVSFDKQVKVLDKVKITHDQTAYIVSSDGSIVRLSDQPARLGPASREKNISVMSGGENLIMNGSFDDGKWGANALECGAPNSQAKVGLQLINSDAQNRKSYIKLSATNQIGCTYTDVNLANNPGVKSDIFLNFDYRAPSGRKVGYVLEFNDKDKSRLSDVFYSADTNKWHTYTNKLTIPVGATTARLYAYAYGSESNTVESVIEYDNFSIEKSNMARKVELEGNSTQIQKVKLNTGDNKISLGGRDIYGDNQISNGNFDSGTWTKEVGDCNQYDDNPQLEMAIGEVEGTKKLLNADQNYLTLKSQRHTACTWNDFRVDFQNDYILGFNYKVIAGRAGYHILFNDQEKTTVSGRLDSKKTNDWDEYSRLLTAPPGATQARITLYAYGNGENENSYISYDNISLRQISRGNYYILEQLSGPTQKQSQASTNRISPTEHRVRLRTKDEKFVLSFFEQFHSGWEIEAHPISKGPTAPNNVPIASEHFIINGYANGWIVDTEQIKKQIPSEYWKVENGELFMDIRLHFSPQDSMNKVVVISGTTLAGCISYLVVNAIMPKRRKKHQFVDPRKRERPVIKRHAK